MNIKTLYTFSEYKGVKYRTIQYLTPRLNVKVISANNNGEPSRIKIQTKEGSSSFTLEEANFIADLIKQASNEALDIWSINDEAWMLLCSETRRELDAQDRSI